MTVSRYMNNPELVAETTRRRLDTVISALRYEKQNIKPRGGKRKDVADKTGFSLMTVSRGGNNTGCISDKVKRAVEQAMSELCHRKNDGVKGLTSSRDGLCFIIFDKALMSAETMNGIARVSGKGMIPCVLPFGSQSELFAHMSTAKRLGTENMFVLLREECPELHGVSGEFNVVILNESEE